MDQNDRSGRLVRTTAAVLAALAAVTFVLVLWFSPGKSVAPNERSERKGPATTSKPESRPAAVTETAAPSPAAP